MPVLIWSLVASLVGLTSGIIYEKESNKTIIESAGKNDSVNLNFWDKALMAAAGVAAFWVWKNAK